MSGGGDQVASEVGAPGPVDGGAVDGGPTAETKGERKGRGERRNYYSDVVDQMLEDCPFVEDVNGLLYQWNGQHWSPVSAATLNHLVWSYGGRPADHEKVRRALSGLLRVRVHDRELQWGRVADHEIALTNGVLDIREGSVRPHRPEDFLENVLPWAWRADAQCPTWLRCLEDWFGSVDDAATLGLQDFMGYVLLSHAKYKKGLLLHGPGDTGKSVILAVMRMLVGPKLICKISVEHMDDPRLLAPIRGKRLNIITELSGRALVADSGFKTLISTEEAVELDEKYVKIASYVPIAKHVIATNELPRIVNRTAEIFARLLIVPMTRVMTGDRIDRALDAKLRAEMPGILAWSVAGARALIERGGLFVDPPGAQRVLDQWLEETNPLVLFARENLMAEHDQKPRVRTPVATIAERWAGQPPSKQDVARVAKLLKQAGYELSQQRPTEAKRGPVLCVMDFRFAGQKAADMTGTDFLDGGAPG